jgi:hypothetical protein
MDMDGNLRRRGLAALYDIDIDPYQPSLQNLPRPGHPTLPSFIDLRYSRLHHLLGAYNIDSSRLTDQTTVTEYIYCIKLPQFVCKPQSTSTHSRQAVRRDRRPTPYPSYSHQVSSTNVGFRRLADYRGIVSRRFKPQQTLYEVVKIGKTDNPARRFHEILGPFQKFPEVWVPLLQEINSTDDPQTVLRKVKSHDTVIFLVKVRDIGTAEGDIRNAFGTPLGQGAGFIDQFLASISDEEQKKRFKGDSGMTEWVVMDAKLAANLQYKFRTQPRPFVEISTLWPYDTPSGEHVHQQLLIQRRNYYHQILRSRSTSLPPELISFPPTEFSYTLRTPT